MTSSDLEPNLNDSYRSIENSLTEEGLSLYFNLQIARQTLGEHDHMLYEDLMCDDRQLSQPGLGFGSHIYQVSNPFGHNGIHYLLILTADYTLDLLHSPFALMLRPHL